MSNAQQIEYVQAKPVAATASGAPQTQVIDPRVTAKGGAPGGRYEEERYCGVVSILIGCFLFPCICCCPVDKREVYTEPTGRKIVLNGPVNV